MKKLSSYIFLIFLFNLCISFQALGESKNYFKGKFYSSVKNNFLVATDKMRDPKFKNTVVVMLDNDENGAFGLVINKPLGSIPLASLIKKLENQSSKKNKLYNIKVPVHWGGPVNVNKIFILHSKEYESKSTRKFKDVSLSSDYKILFEIADKKGPKKSLIIMGYSGWGGGQLEDEMEKEHWTLSKLDVDLIFKKDNSKKWLNAIENSFIRL
jgi:putative transcriptional regulator